MGNKNFYITPETKIGKILDEYPESEEILIGLSPAFSKLKNPVLRKTVAKVATIQQVSKVGGISINTIINTLHTKLGITHSDHYAENENKCTDITWVKEENITQTLDARPILDKGEQPISQIQEEIKSLSGTDIYLLITPFPPVPLLEMVEKSGYKTTSKKIEENKIYNYICKNE